MVKKILSSGLIFAESAFVLQVPCFAEELKKETAVASSEDVTKKDQSVSDGNKLVKVELKVVSDRDLKKEENRKPWYRFGFVPGWVKEIIAEFDLFLCTLNLAAAIFYGKSLVNILRERSIPQNPRNIWFLKNLVV